MRHEILTVGDVFGNAISTHRRQDLDFPLRAEETVTRAVSCCARNQFLTFQVFRESSITHVHSRFKGLRSSSSKPDRSVTIRSSSPSWMFAPPPPPRSPTALPDGKSSRRHSTSIANLNINSPSSPVYGFRVTSHVSFNICLALSKLLMRNKFILLVTFKGGKKFVGSSIFIFALFAA